MTKMVKIGCFSVLIKRKKKSKGEDGFSGTFESNDGNRTLHVKLEHPIKAYVSVHEQENSTCKVKVVSDENSLEAAEVEAAYEGSDEHDENASSMKRDFSDFDLQAQGDSEGTDPSISRKMGMGIDDSIDTETNDRSESRSERETEGGVELIPSGHVSDPGTGKAKFWASPTLKRSCSNLETRDMLREILIPNNSQSFEDLQNLRNNVTDERIFGSPASVITRCSADRVMLKKHSSSQILPSRSKKLWWKLFLWSHRNLHNSKLEKQRVLPIYEISDQKGGYCSDTLEPSRGKKSSKLELPGSSNGGFRFNGSEKWDDIHGGGAGLWPQNQWVAFPASSSLTRVDEWVNSLKDQIHSLPSDEETGDDGIVFPPSPENKEAQSRGSTHGTRISEELLHANSVIQSLNSSSTVAHISGMGLKVIPTMSCFSSLRSVNLSSNFIVRITPGSLPKGLHTLNLSRNKIATIEGLRELTRLRVLDLSYNRISRIGHGLSNCTLIKQLYLAGNKISDVEGLHRLLKLTVVDLSFNKITTAKALGQLVANYHSMQALNLLGNPIQNNIGDDQLRKVVSGLLPQLAYLNKQPIKSQRAREVATNSVAKAALGNNGWTSRRKTQKRVSSRGSSPSTGYVKSNLGGRRKDKHKSTGESHVSPLERRRYAVASSTR